MNPRADVRLVFSCTFDSKTKKITFSQRNCDYERLKARVEESFSLRASSYIISYTDDDSETTNISCDRDLAEAIEYFQTGGDDKQSVSSGTSMLSVRSSRKITLRFDITVEGPSLSDSGSILTLDEDEYRDRNRSHSSFSFGAPSVNLDDDAATVSSRDTRGLSHTQQYSSDTLAPPSGYDRQSHLSGDSSWDHVSRPEKPPSPKVNGSQASSSRSQDPFSDNNSISASVRFPDDSSAVFERLRLEEDDASNYDPLSRDGRGAAWLRDQNARAIRTMGVMPEPSVSDGVSLPPVEEDALGELALQRDDRGKYYYSYSSSGSASQGVPESGADDVDYQTSFETGTSTRPRPSSRQLNWLQAQQSAVNGAKSSKPSIQTYHSDPSLETVIPPEVLPFVEVPPIPPECITKCSECNAPMEFMKYVCTTCGEKGPDLGKGKAKGPPLDTSFIYPPPSRDYPSTSLASPSPSSSSFSSSSRTFVDTESVYSQKHYHKPLPSIPGSSPKDRSKRTGYELCSNCIEFAGVEHAIQAGLAPASSPTVSPTSPEDAQMALQWRRMAPTQKGQLRHAYQEKTWGHSGWENLQQDEEPFVNCSACSVPTPLHKSYKCASCLKYYLCRACYGQVHDLHPSHAFLVMPDKPVRSLSNPDFYQSTSEYPGEEESMVHPDVKCYHCMQDIVGARFHCAECDSVDICSNFHLTLQSKSPSHLREQRRVQTLSRRATYMWTKHSANVKRSGSGSKTKSEYSSYARTVVGNSHPLDSPNDNHAAFCNGCNQLIRGVRYQCASCPSTPTAYNLCANCEKSSYILHDPNHIFFKLKRPVSRPIESAYPMVPKLYKTPAGPLDGNPNPEDLNDYLRTLTHTFALCDRHMRPITGVWYRCVYCGKDLCDECEAVDTHNDTHFFLVFKSPVDMKVFKTFAELENPLGSPPVIPYAVYKSDR
uniref:ZZ-type domain-containing protein n=1 Tax=Moniliophthora roreri TaxID=221103 RepID=A0A0W0F4A7_MONRR